MNSVLYSNAIEDAVSAFKNHKASYRKGSLFDVLDWRRPNELQYYIRMVFDHESEKTKAVYITGDMGEAVVYPTCDATLEGMAKCFTSVSGVPVSLDINEYYFVEKVKTASNLWEWDYGLFEDDLKERYIKHFGDYADEEKLEEFLEDNFRSVWPDIEVDTTSGVRIGRQAEDAWDELAPDCNWIYECGMRLSNRVVFWLVALRLAWEQVKKGEADVGTL